jgi:ribonucleoside-diphosphate reductase alpha chain
VIQLVLNQILRLVKFKKLAGGGYFKIVNQSVPAALKKLGYSQTQIDEIGNYLVGYASLDGCKTITYDSLRAKKFGEKEIEKMKIALKNTFDIKFAFNKYVLGEEFCKSIGFTQNEIDDTNFNMLAGLGFSKNEIEEANKHVCGAMTIEGAPHMKDEHLSVFDCANKCGKYGKRFIAWDAHIKMMAATQPFLSGAISKTINMPSNVVISDIEKAYLMSWSSMLKSNALYRDGSKLSQPLNAVSGDIAEELLQVSADDDVDETIGPAQVHETIVQKIERKRLPKKRRGLTQEAIIGGHKVFIQTGEYDDGTLGEVFVTMYKEGAAYRSLMSCFAVAISKALQYGVPLEEFVDSFTFTRFEPAGMVQGHDAIKSATSILDFVFRYLGYEYMGRTDFVHVKPLEEVTELKSKMIVQTSLAQSTPKPIEEIHHTLASTELDEKPNYKSPPGYNASNGKVSEAKTKGYTGESCRECGSMKVRRNGTCTLCEDCGSTSGCS